MIDQIYWLNYLVAGAREMLNLARTGKREHARKYTAILQVMSMWKNYIFAEYHINLFGYINANTKA